MSRVPADAERSRTQPLTIAATATGVKRMESVPSPLIARLKTSVGGRCVMADGTLEALKWGAFILMVLDHANKYFFAEQLPFVFTVGRIVMPIFGFVLAFNLARPDALASGVHARMMFRLSLAGLAATPVVVILNGMTASPYPLWPLNILFTLLLVVYLTYLIERGGLRNCAAALALFLIGGALVEYLWFGLFCCLGAWAYCRRPGIPRLVLWCLGMLSLTVVNGNAWANARNPAVADGKPRDYSLSSPALGILRPISGAPLCAPGRSLDAAVKISIRTQRESWHRSRVERMRPRRGIHP